MANSNTLRKSVSAPDRATIQSNARKRRPVEGSLPPECHKPVDDKMKSGVKEKVKTKPYGTGALLTQAFLVFGFVLFSLYSMLSIFSRPRSGYRRESPQKKRLSPKIDHASDEVLRSFRINETSQFDHNFREECGYEWWRVSNWINKVADTPHAKTFDAFVDHSGIGDRLMGMVGVLNTAIDTSTKLSISSLVYSSSFDLPSDLFLNFGNVPIEAPEVFEPASWEPCRGQFPNLQCNRRRSLRSGCKYYTRPCTSSKACSAIEEAYGRKSLTQIIGCPMRMLLEPKAELKENIVTWFMDGRNHQGTLIELLSLVKNFKTISVHLRFGDSFRMETDPWKRVSSEKLTVVENTIACAESVGDFSLFSDDINSAMLASQDTQYEFSSSTLDTVKSIITSWKNADINFLANMAKQVKWIVSSDDSAVRQYFKDNFPDKVIMLDLEPEHPDDLKTDSIQHLRNIFSEWMLLGAGDYMIQNLFLNWISAFSRSARLYNLKSDFYKVTEDRYKSCLHEEYGFHGNAGVLKEDCGEIDQNNTDQYHREVCHTLESLGVKDCGLP